MYIEKLNGQQRRMLSRAGIDTDEQLVSKNFDELLKIRGVGYGTIVAVNQKVRIPMGLDPLERPPLQPIHPNRKAAQDAYWEKRRKGVVKDNRYRRS